MEHAQRQQRDAVGGEVVDFDAVLLKACDPRDRRNLLHEAQLLVSVFAPGGDAATLERMAARLSAGERDAEMARHHARRLAAALRALAKAA